VPFGHIPSKWRTALRRATTARKLEMRHPYAFCSSRQHHLTFSRPRHSPLGSEASLSETYVRSTSRESSSDQSASAPPFGLSCTGVRPCTITATRQFTARVEVYDCDIPRITCEKARQIWRHMARHSSMDEERRKHPQAIKPIIAPQLGPRESHTKTS
jgi:hypothetical protein